MKLKLKLVRDFLGLLYGLVVYRITGRTPAARHYGLVGLFCETGGRSNELLHATIAKRHPPHPIDESGVFGQIDDAEIAQLTVRLRTDGYAILPKLLPADLCDRLLEHALTIPADVRLNGPRRAQQALAQRGRSCP